MNRYMRSRINAKGEQRPMASAPVHSSRSGIVRVVSGFVQLFRG